MPARHRSAHRLSSIRWKWRHFRRLTGGVATGDLRNESIFITGGGSGLGLALVERFIKEGAQVAMLGLSAVKVAGLRQRFGEHILAVEGNVTCYANHQRAVDQILTRSGKLDYLIDDAGIWDRNASLVNTPAETLETGFHELLSVNVPGYLLGVKTCAPALIASEGSMIFTLPGATWYPGSGGPLYTTSKHAATGLIRQLAYELVPKVRVNGIGPCDMTDGLRGPQALGQSRTSMIQSLTPEEIATILPLQFFPQPADFTGPHVMLTSRRNNHTLSDVMINADAGLAIRGIHHVAAGLNL